MFNRKYIINPGPFSIAMLVGFIGKFAPGNLEEAKYQNLNQGFPHLNLHLPLLHSCKRFFCPKPFISWEFFRRENVHKADSQLWHGTFFGM